MYEALKGGVAAKLWWLLSASRGLERRSRLASKLQLCESAPDTHVT